MVGEERAETHKQSGVRTQSDMEDREDDIRQDKAVCRKGLEFCQRRGNRRRNGNQEVLGN